MRIFNIYIREIKIETNIKVDVQKYWDFFLQISRLYLLFYFTAND